MSASPETERVAEASRSARLPMVQALRAFAALMVVMQHVQHDARNVTPTFVPSTLLPWGGGVDIFFVISGFIIVHASRSLFGQPGAWRRFLARRASRIVPLYWLVTTLYIVVALLMPGTLRWPEPSFQRIAASYLFIPMARPDGLIEPVYSLGWTLNYEAFFYVLFAACIALPLRRSVAALWTILVSLWIIGLLTRWPQPFAYWMRPVIIEFGIGALLAVAYASGYRLSRPVRVILAIAGVTLLATVGRNGLEGPRFIRLGAPAALLVAASAFARDSRSNSTFTRLLVLLGDASYALYLTHPFVSRSLRVVAGPLGLTTHPWLFVIIAVASALLVSVVVHVTVERPLSRRVRSWLEPQREVQAVSV
jgi:exopolysaccharide production protein ExoZ